MSTDNEACFKRSSLGLNSNPATTFMGDGFRDSEIHDAKIIDLMLQPMLNIQIRPEGWLSGRKRRS
jgi:hypothetical protein